MEPRTEAGRQLAHDLASHADRIRSVELEASLDALAWQVADMTAEREWMRPQESSFGPYEWTVADRLDAAIGVLTLRLEKARRLGKNAPAE